MRTSFQSTGPQIFQLGDIVEVQVSFIAIPLRGSKWKISTILRSITLFEGKFTQVKNRAHLWVQRLTVTQEALVKSLTRKVTSVENVKPTLKRRVGYMEEEVSITRARLAEMGMSEDEGTSKERGKDDKEEMDETATQ